MALSALAGVVLGLSYPPKPTWWLAWVALVPFFVALDRAGPKTAAKLGYVMGLTWHLTAVYWIGFHVALAWWMAIPAALFASALMAFWSAAFAWVVMRVVGGTGRRGWIIAPFAWTALDYSHLFSQIAFPWTVIGNTQAMALPFAQQAAWWGVFGVGFWVVVLNVLAVFCVWRWSSTLWRFGTLSALVGLLVLTYVVGRGQMAEIGTATDSVTIGVVQPNMDPATKWGPNGVPFSIDALKEATRKLKDTSDSLEIIVWPETAIPDYVMISPPDTPQDSGHVLSNSYRRWLPKLVRQSDAALLSGFPAYDFRIGRAYNSVGLLTPSARHVQSYDKQFLVPFGERVPLDDVIPILQKINLGEADFTPGRRQTVFNLGGRKFGALICFESVFPNLSRRFVNAGARFLVIVTNDVWFGDTALPWQHAWIGSMRAIEARSWVVRAANTGISGFIDPVGRFHNNTSFNEKRVIVGTVGLSESRSLYHRKGDWIAIASAILTLSVLLAVVIRSKVEVK